MKDTLLELVNGHETFVRMVLKEQKEILPMCIIGRDNLVIPMMIKGGREAIKFVMSKATEMSPDWLVFLTEGYMEGHDMKKMDKPISYEVGELEKRFKLGDEKVKEVIIIHAYTPEGKLSRILIKDTMKQFRKDTEEFDGFLTVSDVDRVFWRLHDEDKSKSDALGE